MNGHCNTCAIEWQCGYEYKPCDCCNYRKFKPKPRPNPFVSTELKPLTGDPEKDAVFGPDEEGDLI